MASELGFAHDVSGVTVYARIRQVTDQKIWNTSGTPAFEVYATANVANYATVLTEQGTASAYYVGTFPASIADGLYHVAFHERAGASAAESDTLVGVQLYEWSGGAAATLRRVNVVQISGDATAADNLESAADGTGYNLGNGSIVAASVTGAVGSVTGAVGSVSGSVGGHVLGNVSGSVGSIATSGITSNSIQDGTLGEAKFGTGAISSRVIDADAIGSSELAASAASEIATAVRSELTTELGRVDVAVSTRLASASYTAPLNAAGVRTAIGMAAANLDSQLTAIDDYIDTEVAAIKSKTDNLPSDPADASDVAAAFSTVNSTLATIIAYIDTEVASIKAKTDNLPASPASVSDIPTASANASAVRTELATELGRVDAAVSSRLAAASYTAPLSAGDTRSAVGLASANLDTQLSGIQSDTDNIQTRLPAALVSGRMSSDVEAIGDSTTAAAGLKALGLGVILGTVSDASPAAGDFDGASGLSTSNDFYNGCVLVFLTGTLTGIARKVSDYVGSTTRNLAFTGSTGSADAPFPTAPSDGDTFAILGRIG